MQIAFIFDLCIFRCILINISVFPLKFIRVYFQHFYKRRLCKTKLWWPVFCSHRVLNHGAEVRVRRARRLVIWCKWLNKVTVRCGLVVVRCAIQMHSAVSQPHPTHPRPCCTLRVFVPYLYRLAGQPLVPSSLRLLHIIWDVNKYHCKQRVVLICLSVLRTDQCHHIKVIQYRRVYIMAHNFDCQLGKSGIVWNECEFGWTRCCMFEYDLALVN